MGAEVLSLHSDSPELAELRRIRKGMAEHDCSMRTFIYIDRLESQIGSLTERLEQLEQIVAPAPSAG